MTQEKKTVDNIDFLEITPDFLNSLSKEESRRLYERFKERIEQPMDEEVEKEWDVGIYDKDGNVIGFKDED